MYLPFLSAVIIVPFLYTTRNGKGSKGVKTCFVFFDLLTPSPRTRLNQVKHCKVPSVTVACCMSVNVTTFGIA